MPIDVLIIGVGSIGHRHVRCFLNTGRARVSICEADHSLCRAIADQYNIAHTFNHLDSALASSPNLAVICTPAHLHVPMAIQIAEQEIDVLIEKPLGTVRDGLDRLDELITRNNLICGVAYVMRQHPVVQDLLEIVNSQQFGRPLQYTLTAGQHFPYYRPAYRDIYYTEHRTGGGAIQDAITHMMNTCQWLLGPTTSLVCDAGHLALEGVTVEDTVHVLTRHGDIMGSLALNQFQSPNEATLDIHFQKGSIRAFFHSNLWLYCDKPETAWQTGRKYDLQRDDLFIAQANKFLDCLETRTTPSCNLQEAAHTLNTNLAMLTSSKTKQWLNIS